MKRHSKSRNMKTKRIIVNKWDTVLVKWIDACSYSRWTNAQDFGVHPANINTVGMFLGEDDEHWIVVLNHDWAANHISDMIAIPKGMIRHVEVLERAV